MQEFAGQGTSKNGFIRVYGGLDLYTGLGFSHLMITTRNIGHKPGPVPMLLPDPVHLLNGDVLRLGEEQSDVDGHDRLACSEEEEEAELEVAKHREEGLRYDKGEEHVHRHRDALPRRADL